MNMAKIKFLNIQKSKIIPLFFIMLIMLSVISANQISLKFTNKPKGDMIMSMRLIDHSQDSVGKLLVTTGFKRGEPYENGYIYLFNYNGEIIWNKEIGNVDSTMPSIRDSLLSPPPVNSSKFYPKDAYGIDFNGNGQKDILLLTESHFYILNEQGMAKKYFKSVPVSEIKWGDIFGDGKEVALIAGVNASMISYNGYDYEFTTIAKPLKPLNSITSANLDSDIEREIITGGSNVTGEGNISVHDYNASTSTWSMTHTYSTGAGMDIKKVIAINLDNGSEYQVGDEKIEILALSEKYVYCFHTKEPNILNLLWSYPIKQGSDLIVANIMGDGNLEIIAAGEKVYVLDKTGTRLWESNLGKAISNVHSSDLNEDGYGEIVAGSSVTYRSNKAYGEIFLLDGSGQLLWKSTENHMTEYVVIKDMDHNGTLDLVLANYSNVISGYENMMAANKADMYFSQAMNAYNKENYRDALVYFKIAREEYRKEKNTNKILEIDDYIQKCELFLNTSSSYDMGLYFFNMGEYQKSILYFEESKKASLNKKDFDAALKSEEMIDKATKYVEAQNYINEANNYMSEQNYDKAYSVYNNALSIYQKLGDNQKITSIQNNMLKIDNYKKALDYFEMGKKYFSSSEYQNARSYFQKASAEFNNLGDVGKVAACEDYISKCNQLIESSKGMSSVNNVLLYGGILIGFLLLIVLLLFFLLLK
ncbi:MAG: Tetratricopeptide repeat protein [Candidatus Methanofastidiosum methylothiophilum]|uniref:Tetratricopeptide repeat protein n=1 Tax=Candidatus Methanofastidiosum methylothiophilum TaxID=1705564 RepID=A0A150ISQ3_9EURY|nr:MAG: Tetratricopeptide repeat protein [Candidatus Methanofastidiosum methylthiophilus]KYC47694.1 MAG: Tetratricopeptide repeat protein [Candidatus Methanofastidiosum methylthiophilus]KYC50300.1 MAG: Tetratricopeptide repeat protein [Candidatus Methanofastidiosum methylthiophilus]